MVANTARSRKAKGQAFQKEIVQKLRKKFSLDIEEESDCFNGDISARGMGQQGIDIILSPYAKTLIPFSIECKKQETTSIWQWIKQAEANCKEPAKIINIVEYKPRIPLVVFSRNRSDTYAVIKFEDLLGLIQNE